MRIDPEDLRRHYESLSSEELIALDREELTELAQGLYDGELARRGLTPGREPGSLAVPGDDAAPWGTPDVAEDAEGELDIDAAPPPDWIEGGVCVWATPAYSGGRSAVEAARTVLRVSGIPCHVTVDRVEPPVQSVPYEEYRAAGVRIAPAADLAGAIESARST